MVELLIQDQPCSHIPPEAVPHLCRALQATGHQVLWLPEAQILMVDSPLEGRIIRCLAGADSLGLAVRLLEGLVGWIQQAGGLVPNDDSLRPHLTVRIDAAPSDRGESFAILVQSRPRPWLSRRQSPAGIVARKLRAVLQVPVGLLHSRKIPPNELHLHIRAGDHAGAPPNLARAVWLGLMAYFHPNHGAGDSPWHLVQSPPAPEQPPAPSEPVGPLPSATSTGGERRVIWSSDGSAGSWTYVVPHTVSQQAAARMTAGLSPSPKMPVKGAVMPAAKPKIPSPPDPK
jgi:hypothetical protein